MAAPFVDEEIEVQRGQVTVDYGKAKIRTHDSQAAQSQGTCQAPTVPTPVPGRQVSPRPDLARSKVRGRRWVQSIS